MIESLPHSNTVQKIIEDFRCSNMENSLDCAKIKNKENLS